MRVRLLLTVVALAGLAPAPAYPCTPANGIFLIGPRRDLAPNHAILIRTGLFMGLDDAKIELVGPPPIPDIDVAKLPLRSEGESYFWAKFASPLAEGQTYTLELTRMNTTLVPDPAPLTFTVAGPPDERPPTFGGITGAAASRFPDIGYCPVRQPYGIALEWAPADEAAIVIFAESGPNGENPRPFRSERDGGARRIEFLPSVITGAELCFVAKVSDFAGNESPYSAPCCVTEQGTRGSCTPVRPPLSNFRPMDGGTAPIDAGGATMASPDASGARPAPPVRDAGATQVDAAALPPDAGSSEGKSSGCRYAGAGGSGAGGMGMVLLFASMAWSHARRRRGE
jgi:hypothetical protein